MLLLEGYPHLRGQNVHKCDIRGQQECSLMCPCVMIKGIHCTCSRLSFHVYSPLPSPSSHSSLALPSPLLPSPSSFLPPSFHSPPFPSFPLPFSLPHFLYWMMFCLCCSAYPLHMRGTWTGTGSVESRATPCRGWCRNTLNMVLKWGT